jgi:programmed cell death protein 5
MDDDELAELRRQRLAQLQAEGGGGRSSEMAQQQEERRRAVEEQKESIIAQILTQDARERLSRVHMVRPDSARMVSDHLVMLAQSGKLKTKVDGAQLVKLLEQVQASSQPTTIKFQRKGEDDLVLGSRTGGNKKKAEDSDSDNFDTSSDEDNALEDDDD